MNITVFGDIHGYWCDFRDAVVSIHEKIPLDLVLQCGDAQPFRDEQDLAYMHCPVKYRMLGDFWMFASGEEAFPIPMLFVGGNHEPWNFLDENRNGGELAPNIEFLGRVGLREINGLRLAGISGVYSPTYFDAPHLHIPYPVNKSKQAAYYNNTDINKALGFTNVDILLLHDWPDLMNQARDETWPSNWGDVGSEHLSFLVETLAPKYVFCGHMHRTAQHKFRQIEIICLSDFHRERENSCVLLDTEAGRYEWPLKT